MAFLVEDVLVFGCSALLPQQTLRLLVLCSLFAAVRTPGHVAEGRGGVVFGALLGPVLISAYEEEAKIHAGDAADSLLWASASLQGLYDEMMEPKWYGWLVTLAILVLTILQGMSYLPVVTFLLVHKICLCYAKRSSYAHCFRFAEVMFWSQGSAFIATVSLQGLHEAFRFWRPFCSFWSCLSATGLVFLMLTACFQPLLRGFAPLLAGFGAAVILLAWGLGPVPGRALWWFSEYILQPQNLRHWMFLWPVLLVAGLLAIEMLSKRLGVGPASPLKKHLLRKSFHLLAICLFLPPVTAGQGEFLALAQLVAALLFIALEVCRACRAPLSQLQDRFLAKYLDKREDISRDLVLTHLYLLLGCSLPLWLEIFTEPAPSALPAPQSGLEAHCLRKIAGLLLIGVGDSCAAIFGLRFGERRWPGSHRTFLGSAAFVVSVFAVGFLLVAPQAWRSFLLATSVTALLEVYTKSIDNLSLPLFFCAFFKALESQENTI